MMSRILNFRLELDFQNVKIKYVDNLYMALRYTGFNTCLIFHASQWQNNKVTMEYLGARPTNIQLSRDNALSSGKIFPHKEANIVDVVKKADKSCTKLLLGF